MRWFIITCSILVSQIALGAEPFARATVETQGNTVPGQQIYILVEVFAPDFFTSPPQFPLFDLPDALVTIPDERAQNMVQTIDGVEYAGIRRSYAIVPEKPGTYNLPPISIALGYSVDGKSIKGVAITEGVSFNVSEGAKNAQGIAFAAKGLTLTQSFDQNPASLKMGDAFVRTITIFAEDTQAMMIPALTISTAEGLTQYPKSPKILDDIQIDRLHGSSRTETIVYTAGKDGAFVIPAISYGWFDLDTGSAQTATLPAINVTVATRPSASDRIAPKLHEPVAETTAWKRTLALSALSICLFALGAWLFKRKAMPTPRRVHNWLEQYKSTRHRRLRRLRSTILNGDDQSIYLALEEWSKNLGHRSLAAWLDAQKSQALRIEVNALERRLFRTKDIEVNRTSLAALVGEQVHQTKTSRRSALPALNPL